MGGERHPKHGIDGAEGVPNGETERSILPHGTAGASRYLSIDEGIADR